MLIFIYCIFFLRACSTTPSMHMHPLSATAQRIAALQHCMRDIRSLLPHVVGLYAIDRLSLQPIMLFLKCLSTADSPRHRSNNYVLLQRQFVRPASNSVDIFASPLWLLSQTFCPSWVRAHSSSGANRYWGSARMRLVWAMRAWQTRWSLNWLRWDLWVCLMPSALTML